LLQRVSRNSFQLLTQCIFGTSGGLTISISRRADCVENPFASKHAPKRVSPPPARAKGAVGFMQC
ncbi:MAG: hypothetical protein QXP01_06270, partial [Candidatus Hadarchaeum sp.]